MATYSALTVAAEIRRRLPGVPVKKLHKLLYYCQGFHLAAFDEPLFTESLEAWNRGPVVAALWREEKYGAAERELAPVGQGGLNTIGYVVSRYGAMTGADLEALTHSEPPWQIANQRRQLTGKQRMPLGELSAFFKQAPVETGHDDGMDDPAEDYEPPADVITTWLEGAQERKDDPLQVDDMDALVELVRP